MTEWMRWLRKAVLSTDQARWHRQPKTGIPYLFVSIIPLCKCLVSDTGGRELQAAGCERIYKDQGISGTRVSRPELDRMLDRLGPGDEVVVWKLDRLGRNTRHLLELLASEVGGAMAQAMVTIISAFAQLERDQLSERTKAGMAAAAANGRKAGRREITTEHEKVKRAHELKARGLKPTDIGKIIGASRATVYRYLGMDS
ncbi:recombinase family protein [Paenarthrobacter ilicis]|uniref:recombinase family protein n=1 Tax=Paenarthrobacter ilicis TaxID=43665 RepID=UPI0028D8C3DA|nr:recombinase family protein [Paenarthrobacter ilicis]